MTTIFNDYLTGEERALAIEEATIENQLDKLFVMVEMVDMQYAMNCRDAELKVLTESGTYDDLGVLYEAAAEDQSQKKEGLFAKISEGIKKLIAFIGTQITNFCNWITGKVESKGPAPAEEYEMPMSFKTGSEAISKIHSAFSNAFNQLKTNKTVQVGTVLAALGTTVLVGKIAFTNEKTESKIKMTKDKVNEIMQNNGTILAKFNGFVELAKQLFGDAGNAVLEKVQEALHAISTFVTNVWAFVHGKNSNASDDNANATPETPETPATPEQSADGKPQKPAAKKKKPVAKKKKPAQQQAEGQPQQQEQVVNASTEEEYVDGDDYSESSFDELISLIDSL